MDNFKLFNNINDMVCILDRKNNPVFINVAFKNVFNSFEKLIETKKYFNFNDTCFLDYDNLNENNPINLILKSKENLFTFCTYQSEKGDYLYLYISLDIVDDYKIIILKDISYSYLYSVLKKENDILKEQFNDLKNEILADNKIKEQAQSQVSKMAVLTKISVAIRESSDINSIFQTALTQLQNLYGAFKTYYATFENNEFKIMFSSEPENIGESIYFDDNIISTIKNNNIDFSLCLKEHLLSDISFQKSVKRIIIPVYQLSDLLGIIVILTNQQFNLSENIEVLQSVSQQLAASLTQNALFIQIKEQNMQLTNTLEELKETQLQLINSEKMASIGQLVAGVAHEINTPLASINSNTSMIKKIFKTELDASKIEILKELSEINLEAVKRISGIVSSLKQFVRLDESTQQLADINKELDLTLDILNYELKNNVTVKKEYSNLPLIKCFANSLNQVFMNIILNGCQAIKEKTEKGEILIKTKYENNNLIVEISDTGIGIPKENISKIFNTGFTTKPKGIGTGLGLPVSKKIIEAHNGTIEVFSELNMGAKFVIKIPSC